MALATTTTGFPLDRGFLDRYRLAARRRQRATSVGGHLRRRQGQSLEFHEFRPYLPGDDFRHIDFRASARLTASPAFQSAGSQPYLVRTFAAEEQITLVISLDTRETMFLPDGCRKIDVGRWLAEALARIALASGDHVVLHRLFGVSTRLGPGLDRLRGGEPTPSALRFLADPGRLKAAARPNHGVLQNVLKPAGVWVIITDLYWPDEFSELARAVARAQDGFRWVILVELDSWPHERTLLSQGPAEIDGPWAEGGDLRLDLADRELAIVDDRIAENRDRVTRQLRRGALDLTTWHWPAVEDPAADELLSERFGDDLVLQRLFRREA